MYTKLAITNIKNNRQFYFPYLLTGIITVAMFYIMCALESNPGIQSMPGAKDLGLILRLGIGVIGIFAVIFLFYTNSFIIKRRKKELGIYNILGMEKRHIAKILSKEAFFTALTASSPLPKVISTFFTCSKISLPFSSIGPCSGRCETLVLLSCFVDTFKLSY